MIDGTTKMSNHRADTQSIFARDDTWSAAEEIIGQRTLQRNNYLTNTQVEAEVTGTN